MDLFSLQHFRCISNSHTPGIGKTRWVSSAFNRSKQLHLIQTISLVRTSSSWSKGHNQRVLWEVQRWKAKHKQARITGRLESTPFGPWGSLWAPSLPASWIWAATIQLWSSSILILSLSDLTHSQDLCTRMCGWLCISVSSWGLWRPAHLPHTGHLSGSQSPSFLNPSHLPLLRGPRPDSRAAPASERGLTTPSCSDQEESGHPYVWITAILTTPLIYRALWRWNDTNVKSLVCYEAMVSTH